MIDTFYDFITYPYLRGLSDSEISGMLLHFNFAHKGIACIHYRFMYNYTLSDIGSILNLSESTVSSYIYEFKEFAPYMFPKDLSPVSVQSSIGDYRIGLSTRLIRKLLRANVFIVGDLDNLTNDLCRISKETLVTLTNCLNNAGIDYQLKWR